MLVPCCKSEFPSALQALRTKPRHFVRLMPLSLNISRNSASLIPANHSSLGRKKLSSPLDEELSVFSSSREGKLFGWNSSRVVIGARRFQGQTSWQISQPKT